MEYSIKINNLYESIVFHALTLQTKGLDIITLLTRLKNEDFADYLIIKLCNTVTKIDLPFGTDLKLVSKKPFLYITNFITPKYYNKHKVDELLYEIDYGNIDYEYAYEYFIPAQFGGCTSVRNGLWFGRNFDWVYDNLLLFIVHTPTSFDRFAVLGVAGLIPGMNAELETCIYKGKDMYKLLPFYLLDGINEKGLFCTYNVVPLDNEESPTIEIPAKKLLKEKVCISMLVRFILDKFHTAQEAIIYLRDYVTIYFDKTMIEDWLYQAHLLIGDCNNTYTIEFINGEMIVNDNKYITNFLITGVPKHKLEYPYIPKGVHKYGMGVERWNIIIDLYNKATTYLGMHDLLDAVKFSNCYNKDKFWITELTKAYNDDSGNIITVDTPASECESLIDAIIYNYEHRDRESPCIWITCHSSIYNICNKQLKLINQEGNEFTFNI